MGCEWSITMTFPHVHGVIGSSKTGGDPEFVDFDTCEGALLSTGTFNSLTGWQQNDWFIVIAACSTGDGPVSFAQSGWTTEISNSIGGIYRRQLGAGDNPNTYGIRPSAAPGHVVAIGYIIRNVTTFQSDIDAGSTVSLTESGFTAPAIAMGSGFRFSAFPPTVNSVFNDTTISSGSPFVTLTGGYDEIPSSTTTTLSVSGLGTVAGGLIVAYQ